MCHGVKSRTVWPAAMVCGSGILEDCKDLPVHLLRKLEVRMDNPSKRDTGPGAHADDYNASIPVKSLPGGINFLLECLRLVFTVISFGSLNHTRLHCPCSTLKKK
jgi:hypothetical protein